jgi:hypothetical protein
MIRIHHDPPTAQTLLSKWAISSAGRAADF